MTTFPARIGTVWASVQSILLQTCRPDAVVLVLSVEEFPDRVLPRSVARLQRRGLKILWTDINLRSHNKLIPTRREFPEATIVTVDDDVLYSRDMLERLIDASRARPGHIVGHRGWEPQFTDGRLMAYSTWMRSGPAGPTSRPDRVFLTGVGGVLYPPSILDEGLLLDGAAATHLTPSADDVWFWAVAVKAGVPRFCTGESFGRPNGLERITPALFTLNRIANDDQIRAVVAEFDLLNALGGTNR